MREKLLHHGSTMVGSRSTRAKRCAVGRSSSVPTHGQRRVVPGHASLPASNIPSKEDTGYPGQRWVQPASQAKGGFNQLPRQKVGSEEDTGYPCQRWVQPASHAKGGINQLPRQRVGPASTAGGRVARSHREPAISVREKFLHHPPAFAGVLMPKPLLTSATSSSVRRRHASDIGGARALSTLC